MQHHFRQKAAIVISTGFVFASFAGCKPRTFNSTPAPDLKSADLISFNAAEPKCDVIIAGGSTAALAAALASAREQRLTCLIEPTDWPGGQMTSSGVSAIDFSHISANGLQIGKESQRPENLETTFYKWMQALNGNPGACWVSDKCYEPSPFVEKQIKPAIAAEPFLKVFLNTVIKSAETKDRQIVALKAVQRTAVGGTGYERYFSEDIADWYSTANSPNFTKNILTFTGRNGQMPIFIDATEFGDLLVLSGSSWLQGTEDADGSLKSNDTCGQATVYPLAAVLNSQPVPEGPNPFPVAHPEFYNFRTTSRLFTWSEIWNYRRLKGLAGTGPTAGDISMQNWNPGNDYPHGYLFLSKQETLNQKTDWAGGVSIKTLREAERHAIGWYYYFKSKAPAEFSGRIARAWNVFGTGTSLSKMPYLRDTRRSIGINDFVLTFDDLTASNPKDVTGEQFPDRVGIGSYVADFHGLLTCKLPAYMNRSNTLPFFIPFRALTNKSFDNMLVAGKTMAQSFHANAATRLHPIEWHSGIAAGVAAAHMFQYQIGSKLALDNIKDIQTRIAKHQPINWTLGTRVFP
ncbi:MAG: FAD-dependent oxidoreductase [Proteobacteria bacterium]|nr:FAD-dependent oxidoreductase [Pseudomonadota bacterium]